MGLDELYRDLSEQTGDVIVRQTVVSTENGWYDAPPEINLAAWMRMAADLELTLRDSDDIGIDMLRALTELFGVQYNEVRRQAEMSHVSEGGFRSSSLHDLLLLNQKVAVMHGVVLHVIRIFETENVQNARTEAA